MQKILRLIARLIVARHECTHVRHCKENAPIYMYYVAPETPMMSSVIADCPDLVPPQYFGQVYAYAKHITDRPPCCSFVNLGLLAGKEEQLVKLHTNCCPEAAID